MNFRPEVSDAILELCQDVFGLDEKETFLHALAVACALQPDPEYTKAMVDMIEHHTQEASS